MGKEYNERGYLNEQFRVFHLSGGIANEVPLHYHEFKKILICVDGTIGYMIEGRHYELGPSDIILVDAGEIHRPLLYGKDGYERVIIYLSSGFLEECKEADLNQCFRQARNTGRHLFREEPGKETAWVSRALALTLRACEGSGASQTLQRCRLMEFLILLNDRIGGNGEVTEDPEGQNQLLLQAMEYINQNLKEELSIDEIAEHVHLHKSYLMHLFKAETGDTIGEYITKKRLFAARYLMKQQLSMTEVCYGSGFTNYTSFYRAYKKQYGVSPRDDRAQKEKLPGKIRVE